MSNWIFTHCIWDLRQMANQNKVTLPLPYWVRAPNVTRCYRIWREKWKAISLLLICRMMKSVFIFFSSRVDSFNSQFCFHERHKVDQTTQLKKKVHPSFLSENSQMKRIFLKAKQVDFSPLYLQVKQTCTLYFHWTQNKWTEASFPLLR